MCGIVFGQKSENHPVKLNTIGHHPIYTLMQRCLYQSLKGHAMTVRSGRPSVSPSEAKNFKILIAITPVMYEAVEQFGLDSGLSKYGRSAVLRELLEIALTAKGYLTPSTRSATPAWRGLSAPPTAPQSAPGEIVLDPEKYERYAPHRREEMMQRDREYLAKNGRAA